MIFNDNLVVLQGLLKAPIRVGDHDTGLSTAPQLIAEVAHLGAAIPIIFPIVSHLALLLTALVSPVTVTEGSS